jgi:hypothetical protein
MPSGIMLNIVFKLCVIMMSVVRLSGILLSVYVKGFLIVIKLNVAISSGVMLTVIQLIVIMSVAKAVVRLRVNRPSVVAPVKADAF